MSMSQREAALAVMDQRLRLDPAWRFYRTFATPNQRAIIESPALYLHISKPNQVGGTATMLVDAALYLKGIHPVRPRPKEPMQLLFIVPKKAQMGSIFGRRLFKESSIVTNIPAYAHILAKEPDLADLGKKPLICTEAEAHLEKTGSSMGRVVSKASVPGPYGIDELYFYISGDENAWETVMGNNYHGIYRDESVAKGQNLMPELRTRVGIHHDRHSIDRPGCGYIRWGCLAAKFSEELRDFAKLCAANVTGHAQVKLDSTDNPAISKQTRENQALGMSAAEASKRLWNTTTVFDESLVLRVDREVVVHPGPYTIQPEDNLWLSYDPGWKDPCGIALWCCPKDSQKAIMVGWRSWAGGTTTEHAKAIADLLAGRYAMTIVYDYQLNEPSKVTGISTYKVWYESLMLHGVRLQQPPCISPKRYASDIPLLRTFLTHQDGWAMQFDITAPGVEEAMCQYEAYRYKEGASRQLLETNIYQRNVEAVDCGRYFVSRFGGWVDIGSNLPLNGYAAPAAATPIPAIDEAKAAYEAQYDAFMDSEGGGNGLQFETFTV